MSLIGVVSSCIDGMMICVHGRSFPCVLFQRGTLVVHWCAMDSLRALSPGALAVPIRFSPVSIPKSRTTPIGSIGLSIIQPKVWLGKTAVGNVLL